MLLALSEMTLGDSAVGICRFPCRPREARDLKFPFWQNGGWRFDSSALTTYRSVCHGSGMQHHEALVILNSAERTHRLPRSQGGHGHPLTVRCFMSALNLNARICGYAPTDFRNQFKQVLPALQRNGYVRIEALGDCGFVLLEMTSGGRAVLDRWNREGCESHAAPNQPKPCHAPILREREAA